MIWHLIAAAFAGLGAAGIGLLLRLISGKRLPRWIIPVFAGLGVLGYQIHHEYTWFTHKQHQLPASAEVVSQEAGGAIWRPWTYLFPMTTAFSVVDRDNLRHRQADDHRLVEFIIYRFEQQYVDQVTHQAYLLNCTTRELLPLVGEARQPNFEALRRLGENDTLYGTVCEERA